MAEDKDGPKRDVLLIAQVKAYLLNGETIELLPFQHEQDVRGEVKKFIEEWAKTGFLLQARFMYPWHQVRQVEVVSVQELTHAQARPYLDAWKQDGQAEHNFWKTQEQKEGEDESKDKK